jgi:phage FluMu gp28-like protein
MVAVVVKERPAPEALLDWLATVPGFIQGGTSVDERPTRLYDYQVRLLTTPSRFRAVLKSRQTGLSFSMAAEGLAKTHLKAEHTGIFVSYNLADAKEKIRHADMLYESLPAKWRKRRVTDNKTELEFEDSKGRRTRLISLPCREPRGRGKADVNLDELPFMRDPRKIYTAAVPIITRGNGSLTLGSTPLGKGDIFYEILEGETEKYPRYERYRIAWWDCPEFCIDVPAARAAAPSMTTDERVARFATEALKEIRGAVDLDSFSQEYELAFVDGAVAFIPWDQIQAATRDADDLPCVSTIEELAALDVAGPLAAGFDVGRRRNASELVVGRMVGERFVQCLMLTLERTSFDLQEEALVRLLVLRPDVYRLCIDETGLGMDLAERMMRRFPERVEGIGFTAQSKSVLAHGLKADFERRNVQIVADRDLMSQVYSVKRLVTVAGNIRLDTDHDEKHHADKFWALALARYAAATPMATEQVVVDDEHVAIGPDY